MRIKLCEIKIDNVLIYIKKENKESYHFNSFSE